MITALAKCLSKRWVANTKSGRRWGQVCSALRVAPRKANRDTELATQRGEVEFLPLSLGAPPPKKRGARQTKGTKTKPKARGS